MKDKPLSQEWLKIIACVTMLIDHLGVALFPFDSLRIIGRIAFPIYCFLLAEGAAHTGNPEKYFLRLLIAMVLSEIPFDLLLGGRLTLCHQNVLFTMVLGFLMLESFQKVRLLPVKLLIAVPFYILAEILHTDYGGQGILVILLFGLAREYDFPTFAVTLILAGISLVSPGYPVRILGLRVPIELFCVFAMIPISLYSGKKQTDSPWIQWGFYLFYPIHLAILAMLSL